MGPQSENSTSQEVNIGRQDKEGKHIFSKLASGERDVSKFQEGQSQDEDRSL